MKFLNLPLSFVSRSPATPTAMTLSETVRRIQFTLIESTSCSADQLFAIGSLLSRPDYEDVVVERSIAGLCGYPPCPNALPVDRDRRGRFRVSLREHRVYDLAETYNYCSEACLVRSRAFSRSLNAERVSGLSEEKIRQVLRLFGLWNVGGDELEEEGELGINSLIIKEKVDAGTGEVPFVEWIGPANAIEGYVSQRDRSRASGSNFIPQHNSRKMTDGAGPTGESGIPFSSDMFVANETHEVRSNDYSAAKQDVSEMVVKKAEEASIAEKKTKPKKSTSKTSKVKLKKVSKDYGSNNMDLPTSIIPGDEFGDGNDSFTTGQDISDVIAKQLENVVLEEKMTRKSTGISRPSRIKQHHKLEDATNEKIDYTRSISVGDKVGTMPGQAFFNAKTSLEELDRRVEDLVAENKISKKPSKLLNSKSKKKSVAVNNNGNLVMESCVSIRDRDDAVSSNLPVPVEKKKNVELGDVPSRKESQNKVINILNYSISSEKKTSSNELAVNDLEYENLAEKTKSEVKLLKSSLKTSGSKAGSHSVKWADEENLLLEDKKIILQESSKENFDSSLRFTSAEACATALIQASESVASGKTEVGEAISEAGILILPQSQSLQDEKERDIVKWPKKTVLLDTDMFEVQDSWHDTAPEGFSLNLSPFATMWMALFGWVNCSSLAYIYGCDESSLQNFLLVNGKNYPQKVKLRDGLSLEIRQALDGFICRTLPVFIKDQRLPVPVSTVEKSMGCLLDTMSFMDAIPSFKIRQWHVVVFLFIEALSVYRLPVLAPHLKSRGIPLQQMLNSAQFSNEEYEVMRDLILPFGRSTEFSV